MSSQNGTTRGYKVEARNNSSQPIVYEDVAYGKEWREIPIFKIPDGFGATPWARGSEIQQMCGLLSFDQAKTMMWQFRAGIRAKEHFVSIDLRIISHKIQYSFSDEFDEVIEEVDSSVSEYSPNGFKSTIQNSLTPSDNEV